MGRMWLLVFADSRAPRSHRDTLIAQTPGITARCMLIHHGFSTRSNPTMPDRPFLRSAPLAGALMSALLFVSPAADAAELSPEQLAEMNLEQLLGATVTSVARREEQLAQS